MDIQKSKSRSKIDEKPRSENGKSGSKKATENERGDDDGRALLDATRPFP